MKSRKKYTTLNNKSEKLTISNLVTPQQESFNHSQTKFAHSFVTPNHSQQYYAKQQSNSETDVAEDENQKLSDMVSNLLSKNKISSKNAFQVPLVNVSDLRSYYKQDDGSWSKMSSTLENSSRIYGYRVDSVNQNLIKMTNSISRSLAQQKEQPNQIKQCEHTDIKSDENNSKVDLELHLETDRLKQEKLVIEQKCSFQNNRMRRMMDQNGISGIILANVGLNSSLSLSLNFDHQYQSKIRQQSGCQLDLSQLTTSIRYLSIFDQVNNRRSGIIQSKLIQCESDYEYKQPQCNQNMLITFLQQTSDQLLEQVNGQEQNNFNCISLSSDSVDKKQWAINRVNKCMKRQIQKVKKKKNAIKKQKKQRIKQAKLQQCLLVFNSQVVLSKQQILKSKHSRSNKGPMETNNQLLDTNISITMHSIFQLQMNLHSKQNHNTLKYQIPQNQINITHFNDSHSNSIDIAQEKDAKIQSIKENKIQILTILNQTDRIQFSKLCEKHRVFAQNSSQAIDFVSVLHLCNQLNLKIVQLNPYDFQILK